MKALVVEPDGPAALRYADWPDPSLPPGWALVEVRAAGLNRNDALVVRDRAALGAPCVIGSDGAGVVVAVGDGVDQGLRQREVVILPSLHWGASEAAPADVRMSPSSTKSTFSSTRTRGCRSARARV